MHESTSPSHPHTHGAGHAGHDHSFAGRGLSILAWALGLTLLFAGVEVAAGFLSHSLALISDAGHMVTDAAALGLALLAQWVARRPPSARYSFGFARAEALAAFINGLLMLAVVAWIIVEAVQRFAHPAAVHGEMVLVVASIGLAVNLVVAWILSKDSHSLNTRAALVHVMGDLLGSVAAIVAGGVIYLTGWMQIDPLLSLLVSLLILKSTFGVLKESYHFLMQGVPNQIDYAAIGAELARIDGVLSVHGVHVWDSAPGQPTLIGHVDVKNLQDWPRMLGAIKVMLLDQHGIGRVTLQPEAAGMRQHDDGHDDYHHETHQTFG